MTPTRDRLILGPQLDTGTSTPPSPRPNAWVYEGPVDAPASDTGVGSPPARRPDILGSGDAFVPALWL